jgi:hypothetical protein
MRDDGDIVRGLGYVTLYAAYMEEAVEECVNLLVAADLNAQKRIQRWPIGERVGYISQRLATYGPLPDELNGWPNLLVYIGQLLERRNEVIHGRIYGGLQGDADELRPGRPEKSARPITSAELYELANELIEIVPPLNQGSVFSLRRLIARGPIGGK